MKRLVFAAAVAASAAAFADPISAIGFEGYAADDAIASGEADVLDSGETGSALFLYESVSSSADGSTVQSFGGDNPSAPTCDRPTYFADATPNDKYLSLDTQGGTLWRSINPVNAPVGGETIDELLGAAKAIDAASGLYVDTVMQFTITDNGTGPTLSSADKLALWLNVAESGDAKTTNLMVRAAVVDSGGVVTAANFAITNMSVEAESWHRVTILAIADISGGDSIPGFKIYLDGKPLKSGTRTLTDDYAQSITTAYSEDIAAGSVFASLCGVDANPTLKGFGLKGKGAVDDFVVTEESPELSDPAVKIGTTEYDSIDAALSAATSGDTITLVKDLELTSALVFDSAAASSLTLDLGGKTLSCANTNDSDYVFWVSASNSLVVTNGAIATSARGAYVEGRLTLASGASLTAAKRALNVIGILGNVETPATCTIESGATVTHGNEDTVAVFVRGCAGNGDHYNAKAVLNVYGTIVDTATAAGQWGITSNGGNATIAEINFYDGSVYTFACTNRPMMWLPQNDLNLYGGTLTSAGGGIMLLCGKINVPKTSTVTVTANGAAGTYVSYSDGDYTGDALYFAAEGARYPRSQYKDTLPEGVGVDQLEANIAGGTFTSANGEGIAAYVDPDRSEAVAITNFVTGGVYSSEPASDLIAPKYFTKTVTDPADHYTVYRWLYGSGTEADPYLITDRSDLEFFRDMVNYSNTLGKVSEYYQQTADIDLEGDRWVEIGNVNDGASCFVSSPAFKGIYDGGGHCVSNFVLSGYSYCGFFGSIFGGTVKNLQVLDATSPDVYSAGTMTYSLASGAIFCGDMEEGGYFENITVSGYIWGNHNVGGFSAWCQDAVTMISCTNLANVGTSFTKLGGFHAYYGSTATLFCSNCCNKGTLTFDKIQRGTSKDAIAAVGGFVGYQQAAGKMVFVDCVNEGAINATYTSGYTGAATLGGFVGRAQTSGQSIAITNGVNSGAIAANVTATNEQAEVGGFIGMLQSGATLSMSNVVVTSGTTLSATVQDSVTPYVSAFVGRDHNSTQTAILAYGVAPSEYEPGIASGIAGGYDATSTADGLTTYYIEPPFSVDWATTASEVWGDAEPTAEELEDINSWATENGIDDPNGRLGAISYLLGCTTLLTEDPELKIEAIEQTSTGWTITVSAAAGGSDIPLSSGINGTLKVHYASTLDGEWTEETYTPAFSDGKAAITVTAEGARFMKAVLTK